MPISGVKFAGPPITPEDIAQLEKAMNVDFPTAYREFLLKYNGGRPTPEDSFGDSSLGSMIGEFYSVKNDRRTNTIAHQRFAFEGRIPTDLLPIATDMGSNQVCMGITPDNHGEIYFWTMVDEPRPEDEDKRANIWKLADDFASFLAGRSPRHGGTTQDVLGACLTTGGWSGGLLLRRLASIPIATTRFAPSAHTAAYVG